MERVKVRAKSRTRVSDRRIEMLRGRLGSLKISVQGSKIYSTALSQMEENWITIDIFDLLEKMSSKSKIKISKFLIKS